MIRPGTHASALTLLTASLAISLAACQRDNGGGEIAVRTPEQAAAAHDSTLVQQNALLEQQKDSLFGATRSLLAAIASIDSATTQAGVKSKAHGEPIVAYEEGVRQRTLEALKRLRTTQIKLRAVTDRLASVRGDNAALKAQVDTFRVTVEALQNQVAMQTLRGDSLMRQLTLVQGRADSLAGRTRQLATTIDSMTTENHRVFVVAGTKDFLVKHGIVEQVGGSRFPFIVRVGSTLRPANAHPDTTLFTAFDMTAVHTIPVDSTKRYEVVSSQDLTGVDHSDIHGRTVRGAIRVTDPERFWRASPYLILVQQ